MTEDTELFDNTNNDNDKLYIRIVSVDIMITSLIFYVLYTIKIYFVHNYYDYYLPIIVQFYY